MDPARQLIGPEQSDRPRDRDPAARRDALGFIGPRSFAWHITMLALGLILPSLLFIGLLVTQFAASERSRFENEAQGLARILAIALDREIDNVATTLQALAAAPSLDADDLASYFAHAQRLRQQQNLHISLRNDKGVTLLSTRLPFGERILNNAEHLIASDRVAMAERRTNVSDVFIGPVTGQPAVQIMVPVLFDDPARLVVGASLELSFFRSILDRFERGVGWTLSITDRRGFNVSRTPDAEADAPGGSDIEAVGRPNAGRGFYYGTSADGIPSLIAFYTSAATGWKLSVSMPAARIDRTLRTSLLLLALAGVVLGGIGFSLAYLVRRRLARAVQSVSQLASSLGQGGSAQPVPADVTDVARIGQVLIDSSRELRETTAELRESEQRLRRVLDNLFAFVGLLQLDGTVIEANNAPLSVAGLTRGDVVGRKFWDTWWWSHSASTQERIRQACLAAAAGRMERFDVDVRIRDGKLITIDFQMAPLRDDAGEIVGLQPSGVDITERVRAQGELARREERSRFLADLRENLDRETEPEAVLRAAAAALTDFLAVDIVSVHEVDQPEDTVTIHAGRSGPGLPTGVMKLSDAYGPETAARLAAGEVVAIDDVRSHPVTRDRSDRFLKLGLKGCLAAPLKRRGEWVGSFVLGHGEARDWSPDIDFIRLVAERVWVAFENARLMRDLTRSQERLQIGLAVSGLGLIELDYLADTATLDHTSAVIFGLDPAIPLPRAQLHERFHPDDAPELIRNIEQLVGKDGRGFMAAEHRILRKDGSIRWISAQKQVVYGGGPDGRHAVSGYLALQDVTGKKMAEEALRASEERLRGFATSNVIGMLYGDIHGGVTYANEECLRIIGHTPEDLSCGRVRWDLITPPEWLPIDAARIAEALERGACTPYEKEYLRPDGTRVPVLVGYTLSEPDRQNSVAFILDLSEQKRIARALEETADRLSLSQEAAGVASWECVPGRDDLTVFSPTTYKLYELPEDWTYSFEAWFERIHPDDRQRLHERLKQAAVTTDKPFEDEYRVRRAAGGWKWLYTRGRAITDPSGTAIRLAGINMDISVRKELEERQTLLIHELHHRIKNTLATIQAIARSSLRSATSMDEFRRSFSDRLMSLGRSHTLLTDNAWAGADLRELIQLEVDPYDDRQRITLEGPPVALRPETAVPLGMGLHELATNAAKYGALSVGRGRLSVAWDVVEKPDGPYLVINWTERDGPAVTAPQREGFGSRLLDRVLGPQIGGDIKISFDSEGLTAIIEAPLSRPPIGRPADGSESSNLRVWTGILPKQG